MLVVVIYIIKQRGLKMEKCIDCGSFAINHHLYGRQQDEFTDLCDVCYWRKKYNKIKEKLDAAEDRLDFFNSIKIDY